MQYCFNNSAYKGVSSESVGTIVLQQHPVDGCVY